MTFKKVQESKEIGKQIIDGQELPIIQPEVHMEVKNKKTGVLYANEEEAQKDINDSSTTTTESDIQRDVNIIVPELPMDGETN